MQLCVQGELFSWGLGCHGELGLGRWAPLELTMPRQCSAPHVRIVSVACGANHTLAIAENGTLCECGSRMNVDSSLHSGAQVLCVSRTFDSVIWVDDAGMD